MGERILLTRVEVDSWHERFREVTGQEYNVCFYTIEVMAGLLGELRDSLAAVCPVACAVGDYPRGVVSRALDVVSRASVFLACYDGKSLEGRGRSEASGGVEFVPVRGVLEADGVLGDRLCVDVGLSREVLEGGKRAVEVVSDSVVPVLVSRGDVEVCGRVLEVENAKLCETEGVDSE